MENIKFYQFADEEDAEKYRLKMNYKRFIVIVRYYEYIEVIFEW